jgi:hypothetical protein
VTAAKPVSNIPSPQRRSRAGACETIARAGRLPPDRPRGLLAGSPRTRRLLGPAALQPMLAGRGRLPGRRRSRELRPLCVPRLCRLLLVLFDAPLARLRRLLVVPLLFDWPLTRLLQPLVARLFDRSLTRLLRLVQTLPLEVLSRWGGHGRRASHYRLFR